MLPLGQSVGGQKITRTYLVTVSVVVDDASKPEYQTQMNDVEAYIFNPMKRAASSLDAGSKRLAVDVQLQKDAQAQTGQ